VMVYSGLLDQEQGRVGDLSGNGKQIWDDWHKYDGKNTFKKSLISGCAARPGDLASDKWDGRAEC
jgi:hypothetical protein